MSNYNKYVNWRLITETDYLALFIKTWFSFLGTIHELYPEIEHKYGDKPLIKKYSNKFLSEINSTEEIKSSIVNIYKKSQEIIKTDYPQHYFSTFYQLNKQYKWENNNISIPRSKDVVSLKINVAGNDKERKIHAIIKVLTERSDKKTTFKKYFDYYLDVAFVINGLMFETLDFINKDKIINNLQAAFIKEAETKLLNKTPKQKEEGLKYFQKKILNSSIQTFRLDFETKALFIQLPKEGFAIEDQEINKFVLEWFIDFIYRLRNILFHLIIDPFNEAWRDLFRYGYIALKEIVNQNISYLENQAGVENGS